MLREEFLLGGPVMYALFAVWVLMLAIIMERVGYWLTRPLRSGAGDPQANLERIDHLSQIATSLGLFGTVVGIAQSFFSRGSSLSLNAPEALASGLATALFTTVAGLSIFLTGQIFNFFFTWLAERAEAKTAENPR